MSPAAARPLALMLMGPTASGKTGVAVELVQRLPLEIISVDSALVYRGMDIGTAKPDAATLRRAPHRLIDIRDPAESYSAASFREDALREMAAIRDRGRTPLLVGGTMLYFRALERGLAQLPAADAGLRARLEARAQEIGWQGLHAQLRRVDPASAARIHPNDPQRIQRALEVEALTGTPLSAWHAQAAGGDSGWRFLKIVLAPQPRALLHQRIEQRFRQMLEQGFLDEVRRLHAREDLHAGLPSMRAVGYRQAWQHLEGKLSAQEWVERAIIATRQYAKRQFTWLRSETGAHWIDPLEGDAAERILRLLNDAGAAAG
ncbi:MAG TPA: tRNA (adenosine(37)-N6)-dimethylallyltransferase MiaA [Gammaproteobacteria bacterium]|nr:tRNA (adenosine(37)-N6)-dimethylallyltransferase MiaA [Gammaproteobacteria bacterium]